MKLSIGTDYGSPAHMQRVLEFARAYQVSRLLDWDPVFNAPFLYPRYPGLVTEKTRPQINQARDHLRRAAEMTTRAGMEFWPMYDVWLLPEVELVRRLQPELFNKDGEPDMSSSQIYQLIRDQLDELRELAPQMAGIEMWIEEDATIPVAFLKHQALSMDEICHRIVETVYNHLSAAGLKLVVGLHSPGGNQEEIRAMLKAASAHPDIIVSADETYGDFSYHLPFNQFLVQAATTNPIEVNFAIDEEVGGRDNVPASNLNQLASHIEVARKLGVIYFHGKVSTLGTAGSPHTNVMPSRRRFYPALENLTERTPVPGDLGIPSIDTLNAFNAEFFFRRVKDPQVKAEDVVREFLCREFGGNATALVPTFMKLEETIGKLFFTDTNYYMGGDLIPDTTAVEIFALNTHLTCPAGRDLTPEALKVTAKSPDPMSFNGFPTPIGHKCAGAGAMIREKQEALAEAEQMLREVKDVTQGFTPENRTFVVRQFEDLVFYARADRYLLDAQAHYYMAQAGKTQDGLPDPARLKTLLAEIQKITSEWETRYPGGRGWLAESLGAWTKIMEKR